MAKFYITTSIAYVNAPPHIGHALEEIEADVLARYHRLKGDDVFFLTGTDEHGAKIARAAAASGKSPEIFTDEISEQFRALKNSLNLSWDDFIRTTDQKRHWPAVRAVWEKLAAAGNIYKKQYEGLYCVGHEAFVTQKDLADGKCADHGKPPEVVKEENYFFRLSKYTNEIGAKIKSGDLRIIPEERKNEILSFIEREGLEDVSFSRPRKDLSWGIPVPGDDTQTIYVWADALTNYLSAIGYPDKKFEKYWPADVHVIGKDILRFHAAIWPGILLSLGLPLPKTLFVHGFITSEGKKMSKTIGNVVDPAALVEKYGVDAVRYYLLREIPTNGDGDWSEKRFREVYNADLANGLGNFAARVLALGEKQEEINSQNPEPVIWEKIEAVEAAVEEKLSTFKMNEALAAIWDQIAFGDAYVNEKKPWTDGDHAQTIAGLVLLLGNIGKLLQSFLPETAKKVLKNIEMVDTTFQVHRGEPLFPRLR